MVLRSALRTFTICARILPCPYHDESVDVGHCHRSVVAWSARNLQYGIAPLSCLITETISFFAIGVNETGLPMRVTRIKLKNWKNFQDVDVQLQSRTFLVGVNAAGKSNFLDAFRFIRDVVEHGVGKAVQGRGGLTKLRCLYARKEPDIRLVFTMDDNWEYELELSSDRQFPVVIKKSVSRKTARLF